MRERFASRSAASSVLTGRRSAPESFESRLDLERDERLVLHHQDSTSCYVANGRRDFPRLNRNPSYAPARLD
jgi:hypothetical protein